MLLKRMGITLWALVIFTLLFSLSGATVIGSSSIHLGYANAALAAGKSISVPYAVTLASGSTWGTTLAVSNTSYLSSHGISASLSDTYGDPTYTGSMSITLSNSVPAGTYNITLSATGDDPSQSNAVFTLTVLSAPSNTSSSTSVSQPTVPSTLPTTPSSVTAPSPSTAVQNSSAYGYPPTSSSSSYVYLVVLVIIIVVIIAAAVLLRKH